MQKLSQREVLIWSIFVIVAGAMLWFAGSRQNQIGQEAPALTLPNATGELVDLHQHRGQVVVLNFFATWCPPCKVEIPDLSKFHARNEESGREVSIYGIVLESGPPTQALAESARLGVDFPILVGTSHVAARYNIQSFPTTVIIDTHGNVHQRIDGLIDLETLEAWTEDALTHNDHEH